MGRFDMEDIPFFAIGNDELVDLPLVKKGNRIKCKHCKKKHILECGTTDGKENDFLLFYHCGKESYLAAIEGRLLGETDRENIKKYSLM